MACSLVGNAALYASLLFGYFFLVTMASERPGSLALDLPIGLGVASVAGSVVAALAVHVACVSNRRGGAMLKDLWMLVVALASMAAAWSWFGLLGSLPDADSHAYIAATVVLICYSGGHCAVAGIIAAHVALRGRKGYVSAQRGLEPAVVRLWVMYTLVVVITAAATMYLVAGVFS